MYRESQANPVYTNQLNLTGAWQCNDGGAYFIRQFTDLAFLRVVWLGLSQRGLGDHFTNVFSGLMVPPTFLPRGISPTISGNWADVPRGATKSSGRLEIRVEDNGRRLRAIQRTGGFGGSIWTRL